MQNTRPYNTVLRRAGMMTNKGCAEMIVGVSHAPSDEYNNRATYSSSGGVVLTTELSPLNGFAT